MVDFDRELGWVDRYTKQYGYIREKGYPLDIRGPVLETWFLRESSMKILLPALEILKEEHPVTIRHVYYCLVGQEVLAKEERDYKKLVRITRKGRLAGLVPMEWIIDSSRRVLELALHDSVKEFLTEQIMYYYRNTWKNQSRYILVWVEKEALARPLWQAVHYYNVPVFPAKGYDSWSHFLKAVKKIRKMEDKEIVVLYLGDHDPSGLNIPSDLQERCKLMNLDVRFERIAITEEQIKQYDIPRLPLRKNPKTGKYKDTRAPEYVEKYGSWFVELDALKPSVLKYIVAEKVKELLDLEAFEQDLRTQDMETDFLGDYLLSDFDECFEQWKSRTWD